MAGPDGLVTFTAFRDRVAEAKAHPLFKSKDIALIAEGEGPTERPPLVLALTEKEAARASIALYSMALGEMKAIGEVLGTYKASVECLDVATAILDQLQIAREADGLAATGTEG